MCTRKPKPLLLHNAHISFYKSELKLEPLKLLICATNEPSNLTIKQSYYKIKTKGRNISKNPKP